MMDLLLKIAPLALFVAYLATEAGYGILFFSGKRTVGIWAAAGLRMTALLHFAVLAAMTIHWSQFPAATVSQALSVVAFAVAAIYILLEWLGRDRTTGFWMIAQVCVFQFLAVVFETGAPPQVEVFQHPLFGFHVALGLLGYASFAVAASYAFLFLRLYAELKRSRFSTFYGKLPPLQVLERMMVGALKVGFLALTGALIDGAFSAVELHRGHWPLDPMILITLATWTLYGSALLLKRLHRWQGRQTAFASITGLGVILASLVVVHLFQSGFHRPF